MIEVEIKVHISEAEYNAMSSMLTSLGYNFTTKARELDIYFDGPNRNYFESGEALRIRSSKNLISSEKQAYITYKGKKLDNISNTRVEHEVKIDNIKNMEQLFDCLGFVKLFTVEKQRNYYTLGDLHVCVDYVKDLGYFLELEKVVSLEAEKSSALVELFLLLNNLSLSNDRLESKSYAQLLFEKIK